MKKSISILIAWCIFAKLANAQMAKPDQFTVYLFLLEDCKITQSYTDKLAEIYTTYGGDSIAFVGLFPNPLSNDETVEEFASKYEMPFPCTRQYSVEKALEFGIQVTPEVVLYNETRHEILYQGRIDNMFERIGQRRNVVTSFELEAALYSVRNNREVPIPRTTPVGCFLRLADR